ncbi:hypothetical protein BJ508DRAFT_173139 [Ascobolus immersus RN42]|uniref:Uncharacterized protein n=1 Tax=Ascobolus immersus RN42 TaxID=1160509 RepID=A0A3N4HZ43_ASCIM|nr:hypothetical protein BJ508DRAFT_173139 [Ascobolus immersus RN42]
MATSYGVYMMHAGACREAAANLENSTDMSIHPNRQNSKFQYQNHRSAQLLLHSHISIYPELCVGRPTANLICTMTAKDALRAILSRNEKTRSTRATRLNSILNNFFNPVKNWIRFKALSDTSPECDYLAPEIPSTAIKVHSEGPQALRPSDVSTASNSLFLQTLRSCQSSAFDADIPIGLLQDLEPLSIGALYDYILSVESLQKADTDILKLHTYSEMGILPSTRLEAGLRSNHSNSPAYKAYQGLYSFWGIVHFALLRLVDKYKLQSNGEYRGADSHAVGILKDFTTSVVRDLLVPILAEADRHFLVIELAHTSVKVEQIELIMLVLERIFGRLRLMLLDGFEMIWREGLSTLPAYYPIDSWFSFERGFLSFLVRLKSSSIGIRIWRHLHCLSTAQIPSENTQVSIAGIERVLKALERVDTGENDGTDMPVLTTRMLVDYITSIDTLENINMELLRPHTIANQGVTFLHLARSRATEESVGGLSGLFEATKRRPSRVEEAFNRFMVMFAIVSFALKSANRVASEEKFSGEELPSLDSHSGEQWFIKHTQVMLSNMVSETYAALKDRSMAGMLRNEQVDLITFALDRLFRKFTYFLLRGLSECYSYPFFNRSKWLFASDIALLSFLIKLRSESIESRILRHIHAEEADGLVLSELFHVYEAVYTEKKTGKLITMEGQEKRWEWQRL